MDLYIYIWNYIFIEEGSQNEGAAICSKDVKQTSLICQI